MSNDDVVKELQEQAKQSIEQYAVIANAGLEQRQMALDESIASLIEQYSNSIRNLGVISGVVAPLSLSLLTVEKLDVNIIYLVLGFILLILNIVVSQLFLDTQLSIRDRKISQATLEWISASTQMWAIQDETKDTTTRANSIFEFDKNSRDFDAIMGRTPLDVERRKISIKLGKYNKIVNYMFSMGCGCIILSTFYSPLISALSSLFLRFYTH